MKNKKTMSIKLKIIKVNWVLIQFGFDLKKIMVSIISLPYYFSSLFKFKKKYKEKLTYAPCLHDRFDGGGSIENEYFWQDLFYARIIHDSSPKKHIDIGSRIDGFVSHIASYRDVEVIDIRPLNKAIQGLKFHQANVMDNKSIENLGLIESCDSLSCLHVIEHFGLGRYGDPIDPDGYKLGIQNMIKILKKKGTLYLSTPIGKPRVEFNANRVFDPNLIIKLAKDNGLHLKSLNIFNYSEGIIKVLLNTSRFENLNKEHYNLGMFIFIKD